MQCRGSNASIHPYTSIAVDLKLSLAILPIFFHCLLLTIILLLVLLIAITRIMITAVIVLTQQASLSKEITTWLREISVRVDCSDFCSRAWKFVLGTADLFGNSSLCADNSIPEI